MGELRDLKKKESEEAVSRVLCAAANRRVTAISLGRALPRASSDLYPRAPGGPPFRSRQKTAGPSPSYSVLLRVGFAVPVRSPGPR